MHNLCIFLSNCKYVCNIDKNTSLDSHRPAKRLKVSISWEAEVRFDGNQ